MKYFVIVEEIRPKRVIVEAISKSEALNAAFRAYKKGEISMEWDEDECDCTFSIYQGRDSLDGVVPNEYNIEGLQYIDGRSIEEKRKAALNKLTKEEKNLLGLI